MAGIKIHTSRENLTVLPHTSAPDYSGIARSGAQVAQAANQIGAGVQGLAQGMMVLQARKDDEEATRAFNDFRSAANGIVIGQTGPDGIFQPGMTSRTLNDASGVTLEFDAKAKQMMESFAGKLSPKARKLFEARAVPLAQGFIAHLSGHEAGQSQKARIMTYTAGAESALEDAAKSWDNDDVFKLNVSNGAAELAAGLTEQGTPVSVISQKTEAYKADADERRISAMISNQAYDLAEAYVKQSAYLSQEKKDFALSHVARGRETLADTKRKMMADQQKELQSAAGDIKNRFFKGDYDAAAALTEVDRLERRGLLGEHALDVREFVVKAQKSAADAAELANTPSTWAKQENEDTAGYMDLLGRVASGTDPWDTEMRIQAAAQGGALTAAHYADLFATNRKGIDGKTQSAVRAALAAAADMDAARVNTAFERDTESGSDARKKLLSGLKYNYDRPGKIDLNRKSLDAQEFDELVNQTRLFIEANPDKDPYKDFLKPMIDPLTDAEKARTMAERLAVSKGGILSNLDVLNSARAKRASAMAAEYKASRKVKQ